VDAGGKCRLDADFQNVVVPVDIAGVDARLGEKAN